MLACFASCKIRSGDPTKMVRCRIACLEEHFKAQWEEWKWQAAFILQSTCPQPFASNDGIRSFMSKNPTSPRSFFEKKRTWGKMGMHHGGHRRLSRSRRKRQTFLVGTRDPSVRRYSFKWGSWSWNSWSQSLSGEEMFVQDTFERTKKNRTK